MLIILWKIYGPDFLRPAFNHTLVTLQILSFYPNHRAEALNSSLHMLELPVQRVELGRSIGVSSAAAAMWYSLALRRKIWVTAAQPAPHDADTRP